jgi:hypothetical protein
LPDRLIFVLGMLMTIIFASGVTLIVREFRRSDQENKRRAARRALYAKPRVVDIDPKDSLWGNSNHEGLSPANHLIRSKADS